MLGLGFMAGPATQRRETRTYLKIPSAPWRCGTNAQVAAAQSMRRKQKRFVFISILCVLCALAFFALLAGREELLSV